MVARVVYAEQGDAPMSSADQDWVLLAYRLPRVPSTPRSAIWRKLKRLGVLQLGDGVVALPDDPRTREQLEWVAEDVSDHLGQAQLWVGRPLGAVARAEVIAQLEEAVDAEYRALIEEAATVASADSVTRRRVVARLRRELHRIEARDFFSPPAREQARQALDRLNGTDAVAIIPAENTTVTR